MRNFIAYCAVAALLIAFMCGIITCKGSEQSKAAENGGESNPATLNFSEKPPAFVLNKAAGAEQSGIFYVGYMTNYTNIANGLQAALEAFSQKNNIPVDLREVNFEEDMPLNIPVICVDFNALDDKAFNKLAKYVTEGNGMLIIQNVRELNKLGKALKCDVTWAEPSNEDMRKPGTLRAGFINEEPRVFAAMINAFDTLAWNTNDPNAPIYAAFIADALSAALVQGGMVEKVEPAPLQIAGAYTESGVTIGIRANQIKDAPSATISLKLLDVRNNSLGDYTRDIKFDQKQKEDFFAFKTDPVENPYLYRLQVEYKLPDFTIAYTRSLAEIIGIMNVKLLGQNEVYANSLSSMRVIALNEVDNSPIPNAEVKMLVQAGGEPISVSGKTDKTGTLDLPFTVGDIKQDSLKLEVDVKSALGTEKITQDLKVKRAYKIMLNTDKPIYKPGQMMHVRALAMQMPSMQPVSGMPLLLEIEDAKGNKLFKKDLELSSFGIASTDFQLADEINLGTWTVRATVAEKESQEKKVDVKRYVLPKFKVDVKPEKTFYMPGDVVKGEIQSDYFFGKPVANADVKIDFVAFEVEETVMGTVQGKTDDNGNFKFEYQLKDYFVGHPLTKGDAPVILNVTVTDTAAQKVEKSATITVSKDPIHVYAIPESGKLVPGVENIIYLMATYPDGSPAEGATFTISGNSIEADKLGIATVTATPTEQAYTMTVEVADKRGAEATKDFRFDINAAEEQALLRLDKVFTKVGDTLNATVFSSLGAGSVYLDIIRDGQTVLTKAMTLENGKATESIDLSTDFFGTLIVNAYQINRTGQIVRDTKSLYVSRADDLTIAITPDKETYRPGEEATFNFSVTGTDSKPLMTALGVIVVDEAVFALSEMQPGLEKVYFTLEKEIMKPRYEIHEFVPDQFVLNPIRPEEKDRMLAAQVLAAAASNDVQYSLDVNTAQNKVEDYYKTLEKLLDDQMAPMIRAMQDWADKAAPDDLAKMNSLRDLVNALVKSGALTEAQTQDPWGNDVIFPGWVMPTTLLIYSKGPDGELGTSDDVWVNKENAFKNDKCPRLQKFDVELWQLAQKLQSADMTRSRLLQQQGRRVFMGGRRGDMLMEKNREMAMDAMPEAMPMPAPAGAAEAGGAAPPAPTEKPRLRQFFPETLYFNAQVLTDKDGKATLKIPMADNITTWRMSTFASGMTGQLGSMQTGIRVFQDFFIDLNLPVALTQSDYVEVPVAVYNYLKEEQTVTLTLEIGEDKWFELTGPEKVDLKIGPDAVAVAYFPVKATKVGSHAFTVLAEGSAGLKDYIKKSVDVEPDGKMFELVQNGKISSGDKPADFAVEIPQEAVPDAYKIFVKVYPGVMAQVQEGLDRMLQMPCGCFEQTSSSTYPNVLVLDYMKRAKKITPEIQMKAEGFINLGYQKLVAFEVKGGGFSWFGDAPANQILTSYGLMEFHDLSQVYTIDPNVISRTQSWLASQQKEDGHWDPDAAYLHQESWGKIQNSSLLVTAYVMWALEHTKYEGPQMAKGFDYMTQHMAEADNAYTLALMLNAYALDKKHEKELATIIDKLLGMKKSDGDKVWWEAGVASGTYSSGDSANIETTAIIAIGLMNAEQQIPLISQIMNYLIAQKQPDGAWPGTQATILALRALLLSVAKSQEKVNGEVTVTVGDAREDFAIEPKNADVMHILDFKGATKLGQNKISLSFDGEGGMMYQVVTRYYSPWKEVPVPKEEPLTITVKYDKTQLERDDIVTANITIKNNAPGEMKMVMVDLGIPPGFEVQQNTLWDLVETGKVQRFETTGRQIILYLETMKSGESLELSYKMQAKFVIKAKAPKSTVYQYYNPDKRAESQPFDIEVKGQ